MTLFFGAMLAAGVVCLAGTPSAHARLALVSGVAVIVWWCIWLVGAHAAIALLPDDFARGPGGAAFATFAVALFFVMALGNGLSTLAECGTGLCPDNPTSYEGYEALMDFMGGR